MCGVALHPRPVRSETPHRKYRAAIRFPRADLSWWLSNRVNHCGGLVGARCFVPLQDLRALSA